MKVIKKKNKKNVPKVKIPSIGVGTLRASGSWILLMLAGETEERRNQILLTVMAHLGITIGDLKETEDKYPCHFCGKSIFSHLEENSRGRSICPDDSE